MAGTDTMVEALGQRLDRLERENRRVKRVGAVVLVGIAAAALMGQARTAGRKMEAERFVVLDSSGKRRAELGVWPDGWAGLAIFDLDGKGRAGLRLAPDGAPSLALFDPDGKKRAELYAEPNNKAGLVLTDKDGKTSFPPGTAASTMPQAWVLWGQTVAPAGGRLEQLTLALGAWPTQRECEEDRIRREAAVESAQKPQTAIAVMVCLPDTINLRLQR